MLQLILHNTPDNPDLLSRIHKLPQIIDTVIKEECFGIINIAFVDVDEIAQKNKTFRKKPGPTDVLTFPYADDLTKSDDKDEVGDILICLEILQQKHGNDYNSKEDMICMIVTHGLVHMLGYDHQTEAQYEQMNTIEEAILKKLM